jgi:hypothetical protein
VGLSVSDFGLGVNGCFLFQWWFARSHILNPIGFAGNTVPVMEYTAADLVLVLLWRIKRPNPDLALPAGVKYDHNRFPAAVDYDTGNLGSNDCTETPMTLGWLMKTRP